MNPIEAFKAERKANIARLAEDASFQLLSREWLERAMRNRYVYDFDWLGRPIIQNPMDVMALQEILWRVQPDLIIETGIAHGGSLIFSASMLELIHHCGGGDGRVLGIDIEIRPHNREAIEAHPLYRRIEMLEGSSIAPEMVAEVRRRAADFQRPLVILDSNHTHDHVLAELNAYAGLVAPGSYCIVFDTFVEDMPEDLFPDRPWGPGNNPKTAVHAFLAGHPEFERDKEIEHKLLITTAPDGFLYRKG